MMHARVVAQILLLAVAVLTALPAQSGLAHLAAPSSPNPAASGAIHSGDRMAGATPVSAGNLLSPEFWGLNIEPTHPFNATDALLVNATPAQYLRYPSGNYAEQMNYTSSVITLDNGVTETAVNTVADFVSSCSLIHCRAIMELPVEINSTSTIGYYVTYVEQTLGFHPAYWELGNAPATWKHFNAPWSTWANSTTGNTSPLAFAQLVHVVIGTIRALDSATPIIALGSGMIPTYDQAWIGALLRVDGASLAGVSVHDYPGWTGNSSSTLADFFGALQSTWALPNLISSDRAFISSECPNCSTRLFVTEANANYGGGTFDGYLASFDDTLFLAAEVTQAMRADAPNIDWFDFQSNYPGTFYPPSGAPGPDYHLFSDLLSRMGDTVLATQTSENSTFYSVATSRGTAESLLAVNVGIGLTATVNLTAAGFAPGGNVTELYWPTGAQAPTSAQVRSDQTVMLSVLSLALFSNWSGGTGRGGPSQFPVTFTEQGLPSGTSWSVQLGGGSLSTTLPQMTFLELNGSYSYSVPAAAGYIPAPASGPVAVSGAGISIAITFTRAAPPTPLSASLSVSPATIPLGANSTFTVRASGGVAPYTYQYSALPPGCASANSSTLRCTPGAAGNYTVNVTVSDPRADRGNASARLTVSAAPSTGTPPPRTNGSPSPSSPGIGGLSAPVFTLLVVIGVEAAAAAWGAAMIIRRHRSAGR